VVPDRKSHDKEDSQAAGAYVAYPKKGIHKWVGSVDINSLYPSVIRALNMAPETIVGQLRPIMTDHLIKEKMDNKSSFAAAWEGLFGTIEYTAVMEQRADTEITVDWVNGESTVHSARDIWHHVFNSNSNLCLSANGTIFTYEREGVVPGLLKRWYAERKELQAKKKEATTKEEIAFWDKRQLVKKINLNSLYGAILNPGCRFFDKRIGQSTTLTGRAIAQHMDAFINQVLTGEYDHVGECVVYGDTDSCYFSAWPVMKDRVRRGEMEWNKDVAVQLYDAIGDEVNGSFPGFAYRAFHCPEEYGEILACGREVVAESGLFITKKRYALLVYDLEGKRLDLDGKDGKVKAMGLDLKRSDTPKVVQDFLSDILNRVLKGADRDEVVNEIKQFKQEFKERPAWEKGSPKRVNNLTKYGNLIKQQGKVTVPGHVRAAINWNYLRKMHGDNYSMAIVDGMKTIVCKLKPNPLGFTSVGYPTDESRLPEWFKQLAFDDSSMESTVIDQKVENLLGVLDWDLQSSTDTNSTFEKLFSFE
jgi:DNA polymerase elongation subunit (family B)